MTFEDEVRGWLGRLSEGQTAQLLATQAVQGEVAQLRKEQEKTNGRLEKAEAWEAAHDLGHATAAGAANERKDTVVSRTQLGLWGTVLVIAGSVGTYVSKVFDR